MAITLNGTTGITTPDLTSAAPMDVGGSAVLTAASSLAAANLTGALPAIDGSALTGLSAGGTALLSTTTISADVYNIDISLPLGYTFYRLAIDRIATTTVLGGPMLRTSSDGGSTFAATSGDYNYSGNPWDSIYLGGYFSGTATSVGGAFIIADISQNTGGVFFCKSSVTLTFAGATGSEVENSSRHGARSDTAKVNAIRIYEINGNQWAGNGCTIKLYGWN